MMKVQFLSHFGQGIAALLPGVLTLRVLSEISGEFFEQQGLVLFWMVLIPKQTWNTLSFFANTYGPLQARLASNCEFSAGKAVQEMCSDRASLLPSL